MKRSGQYISQLSGYKAFIPSSLPPNPSVKMDEAMVIGDGDWGLIGDGSA